MFLVDEINKIVWICSHKCGISTLSTFLLNLYGYSTNDTYNVKKLSDLGYCNKKEEYKDYYKILVIRNPYEKFISGLLEDIQNNSCFKKIDISFYQFCLFLKKVYNKSNVDYYEKNNKNIHVDYFFTKNTPFVNKLLNHLSSIKSKINCDLEYIDFKLDKIIEVKQLSQCLNEIKKKFNIDVPFSICNPKNYKNVNYSIIDMNICEIARGADYPSYTYFYNEEIKQIIRLIYDEDFTLFEKLNYKNTFENFDILPFNYNNINYENSIITFSKYLKKNCILIIPDKLNIVNFYETLKSINLYISCDVYILVDNLYYNNFYSFFINTNIYLISDNFDIYNNNTVLSDCYVYKYMEMFNSQYENVILYYKLPVFISKLPENIFKNNICVDEIDPENICIDEIDPENICVDEIDPENICVDEIDPENICVDEIDPENICIDEIDPENICVDEIDSKNICVDEIDSKNICVDEIDSKNICVDEIDPKWYFLSEFNKDIHLYPFDKFYFLLFNGIVLDNKTFIKLFKEIKSLIKNTKCNYPVLEVLIPTLSVNNNYKINMVFIHK